MKFDPNKPFRVVNKEVKTFDPNKPFRVVNKKPVSVYNPKNETLSRTDINDAIKVNYMSDTQLNSVKRENFFGMERVDDDFINNLVGENSNFLQDFTRAFADTTISLAQDIKRFGTKIGAKAIVGYNLGLEKLNGEYSPGEMSEWNNLIAEELNVLAKDNQKYREELGIAKTEYDGVTYDLGSLFAQLGMSVLSKSPTVMASVFGVSQQQQISEEVFKNTGESGRSELVGLGVAIPTALLEYVGLDRYLKVLKGNSVSKKIIGGIVTEAIQEGSQAVVEELGTQIFGGRVKSLKDTLKDIAYQMILGGVAGGGIATMSSIGNIRFKKAGFSDETSKEISNAIAEKINNNTDLQKETVNIIKRQNDNTTNYGNNIDNGISKVKEAIKQEESKQSTYNKQNLIEDARVNNVNMGEKELLDTLKAYEYAVKQVNKLKPKSLIQFIKENGGIYDDSGDIKMRELNKQHPFVLRKSPNNNGKDITPDSVARRVWENGYFPELQREPTKNELLDAIDDELRGNVKSSSNNIDDAIKYEEYEHAINQIEANVDIEKIKLLRDVVNGKVKLPGQKTDEDILNEIAQRQLEEAKIRDAEERKRKLNIEYNKIRRDYKLTKPRTKDKYNINPIETYLKPLSTVLKDINPVIAQQVRSSDLEQKLRSKKHFEQIAPFTKKVMKLKGANYFEYDLALKNNDADKLSELNEKYDLSNEYKLVRDTLEEIYDMSKDTGSSFGYRKNYFPTKMRDYSGYLQYISKRDDFGKIQKHLKDKKLLSASAEQQAEAIDIFLKSESFRPSTGLNAKGFTKQRKMQLITSELNNFYDDSLVALSNYVTGTNKLITVNKFFGVNPDKLDEGIGEIVQGLTNKHKLTPGEQQRLSQAFSDYFKSKSSSKNIQIYKNINYLTGLTNIGSTLTQIKDLALSLQSSGLKSTIKAVKQVLNKKQMITASDLGITKAMEELEEVHTMILKNDTTSEKLNKRLSKLLNFSLKTQLFTTMDFFGKNVSVQSNLNNFINRANKNPIELQNEIETAFGEDVANKIVNDLKNEFISNEVKQLLFYKVSDFLPVSKAEMPTAYLRHGGSRLFYTFKTYTIKQLDILNNEVLSKIFSTNTKDIKEGFTNLTKLAFYYSAVGIPVDILKDFIFNRTNDKELSDYVFENILQTAGLSRWNIYNFKRYGADIALMQTVAPPLPIIVDLARDIKGDEYIEDWRTLKNIPIGGKMYYWWFGGGSKY